MILARVYVAIVDAAVLTRITTFFSDCETLNANEGGGRGGEEVKRNFGPIIFQHFFAENFL